MNSISRWFMALLGLAYTGLAGSTLVWFVRERGWRLHDALLLVTVACGLSLIALALIR